MSLTYFAMGAFPVKCGFATDEKSFRKEMRRLKIDAPDFVAAGALAVVRHFEHPTEPPLSIICIDLKKMKKELTADGLKKVLVHEAVHVWQDAKRAMREKEPGDETEAYFIQWLTGALWKAAGF